MKKDLKKYRLKMRTTLLQCFEGDEKIPGGIEIPKEEFKNMRSARITMYGEDEETGENIQVVLTPRQDGRSEFKALVDMIKKEGTFECLGKKVSEQDVMGQVVYFDPPRIVCELSDDKGEQAFKFVPKPVAKWAEKYGDCESPALNFGSDAETRNSMTTRRREARAARRKSHTGTGDTGTPSM